MDDNSSSETSLAHAMQAAIALHRQGNLAGAERGYLGALKIQPDCFDALHYLGVVRAQQGRNMEAASLLQAAIMKRPQSAEALSHLGNVLQLLGRYDEALASYERALAITPANVDVLNNRGNAFCRLGRFEDAIETYRRALAVKPDDAATLANLATVLQMLGRHAEALAGLDRTLALDPDNAEALGRRGVALLHLKRAGEAVTCFDRILDRQPDDRNALIHRGLALLKLEQFAAALETFGRLLALDPKNAAAQYNYGVALSGLQRYEDALVAYRRALQIAPDLPDALLNSGAILHFLGRPDEAIPCYDRALAAQPGYADARLNRAYSRLLLGDFAGGLTDFEARFDVVPALTVRPPLRAPLWRGESVQGKRVIVFTELGLGDPIQMARYIPKIHELGAALTVLGSEKLFRLLGSLDGKIEFISACDPHREFDYQCALMSLPACFMQGGVLDFAAAPYLRAEDQLVAHWRDIIGTQGFRIGICWQGNPLAPIDRGRSIPLSFYAPLARIPGVRLISLQKHHGLDQLAALPADVTIELLGSDYDAGSDAFVDAAAAIMNMDLIVTSDTALAHLAGALGRPTWVALRHVPDWRWLLGRPDNPWYPSVRVFRQPKPDDWRSVFEEISGEVIRLRGMVVQGTAR